MFDALAFPRVGDVDQAVGRVPPDVLVDNTPADFVKGRDAQIEKAIEVLKTELGAKKTTTQ